MTSTHTRSRKSRRARSQCERLEPRTLLANIAIDATASVRVGPQNSLGTHLTWRDYQAGQAPTDQLLQDEGMSLFRIPGGSSADGFHFQQGPNSIATLAQSIDAMGGEGMMTLNYGGGSPQEAAAVLAYLNGSTTNTTVIGSGQQWN